LAALAAREFAARASRRQRSQREANLARYATLAAGTVLASTSGYLLFILATKFPGDSCTWCLTSAALSAAVFGSALRGFSGRCAGPLRGQQRRAPAEFAAASVAYLPACSRHKCSLLMVSSSTLGAGRLGVLRTAQHVSLMCSLHLLQLLSSVSSVISICLPCAPGKHQATDLQHAVFWEGHPLMWPCCAAGS